MRYALFPGIILLLACCTRSPEFVLPKGMSHDSIIPRDQMVRILADVHVLEAVLQYQRSHLGKSADPVSARYDQLFSQYRISKKRFRLNIAYYQSDPEEFLKIYNEVVTELEKRKKELKLR